MHETFVSQGHSGYVLVGPSRQLADVGMEGHVLHGRLQVVQIVLIKWLSNRAQKMSADGSARVRETPLSPCSGSDQTAQRQ